MKRASGILLHLSSLPSKWGIGTLGKEAFCFVDFLKRAGQTYWQILPVGPTSYGDSPYQSYSTFAGNPYLIDLELLEEEGLLKPEDYQILDWGEHPSCVDYDRLKENRFLVLRTAFSRFDPSQDEFTEFLKKEAGWLDDYALYMACKEAFDQKSWLEWEPGLKLRDLNVLSRYREEMNGEIRFWQFVQYEFFKQWNALKEYAVSSGVEIIGDIPIYVALDSADVWANPGLFQLNETGEPTGVSGCPPDPFAVTGQLWGNPLYRWDVHRETGYGWWMERIRAAQKRFDVIRIDHFRGFDEYYAIPYGDPTAENGCGEPGPGWDFFRAVQEMLGAVRVIAEDLGFLTESVQQLLEKTRYPGMKVLQFAFNPWESSSYLPHNHIKNCVVYTGTHDNNTIAGWFQSISAEDAAFCKNYLRLNREEGYNWGFIKAAWASVADTAVAQMQDFLDLDATARMNTPSTVGSNWKWRLEPGMLTEELAEKIREMTALYRRMCG